MQTKNQALRPDDQTIRGSHSDLFFYWLTAPMFKHGGGNVMPARWWHPFERTANPLMETLSGPGKSLSIMGHRCGEVNGEGDGCGVMTDIPRIIWAKALEQEGKPGRLAEDRRFFVGT